MLPKGLCQDSPSLLPKGHYIQQSPTMSLQQRDQIMTELRYPFVIAGVELIYLFPVMEEKKLFSSGNFPTHPFNSPVITVEQ